MTSAGVLVIGNEILSGRTRDANVAFLGAELAALGITLAEVRMVRDDNGAIIAALNAMRAAYTYVFTSGGIGPTHDDITAQAVADAFGVPLNRNPEAVRLLATRYSASELNEARLKMADMPQGATLIENPVSQAPGFRVGNVFVLAGVPRILQAMFEGVKGGLSGGPPQLARSITLGVREGDLADGLAAIQAAHPDTEIGSYPSFTEGRSLVTVVVRGTDSAILDLALAETRALAVRLRAPVLDG